MATYPLSASDADTDHVCGLLVDYWALGVIDGDELDRRSRLARAARYTKDAVAVVSDLPAIVPAGIGKGLAAPGDRGLIFALLDSLHAQGGMDAGEYAQRADRVKTAICAGDLAEALFDLPPVLLTASGELTRPPATYVSPGVPGLGANTSLRRNVIVFDVFADASGRIPTADRPLYNQFRAAVVGANACRLIMNPPAPTGGLDEIRKIDEALWRLIFPDTGRIRNSDVSDPRRPSGYEPFRVGWRDIEAEASRITQEMRNENMLRGLSPDDFARRACCYLVELQLLDPLSDYRRFPDVLRVFMSRRAQPADNEIDWSRGPRWRILAALFLKAEQSSRWQPAGGITPAHQSNLRQLYEAVRPMISPAPQEYRSRPGWVAAEVERLGYAAGHLELLHTIGYEETDQQPGHVGDALRRSLSRAFLGRGAQHRRLASSQLLAGPARRSGARTQGKGRPASGFGR